MCYDPLADAKETLHDWLNSFDAVTNEEKVFDELANCRDNFPSGCCKELGLPEGSNYADAVKLLRSVWNVTWFVIASALSMTNFASRQNPVGTSFRVEDSSGNQGLCAHSQRGRES